MDFRASTCSELADRRRSIATKRCFVGFDGFVDVIVAPVATRTGPAEAFTPIRTIEEFGRRVLAASGKSTNIELYPRLEKLGGNGPIMAAAFLAQGAAVTYVGALGRGAIHPVFAPLASRARTFSLCEPAQTTALEFSDGKLMLGRMRSLDEITPLGIRSTLGAETYAKELAEADLIALINWTMVPAMSAIFEDLVTEVLPSIGARPGRRFFFDLCDPEKRSKADLLEALAWIGRFEAFGSVTLGLNLKEAQHVALALDLPPPQSDRHSLERACGALRDRLGVGCVVVHPKESAACATKDGTNWVPGPYTETPHITTGAGDHFSAGFATAQVLGLSPEACLGVGVATSGHYVRTAESPTLPQLETFLANWR